MFASPNGNPPDPRSLVRNHFDRILEAAESGIRLYDLRHTSASLLLAAGAHPKIVSERLGHSTVMLTLDVYSHVLPSLHEQTAQTMARLLVDPAR